MISSRQICLLWVLIGPLQTFLWLVRIPTFRCCLLCLLSSTYGKLSMLPLRDHPLMSYQGLRNWPPEWTWVGGQSNLQPQGEIGVLQSVVISHTQPPARCFLYVEYQGSSYMGCLLFDDPNFCREVATLLQACCNRSIAEIGSIDVSHTL